MGFAEKLAEFLRLNEEEKAYTGYPQMQVGLNKPRKTGYSTGFLEGATGAEPMQSQGVLTNPNYEAYAQGKNTGELVGIGAMAIPGYAMALRAGAPKAAQAIENYMAKTGGLQYAMPPSESKALMSEFVPGVKAGEEMMVTHTTTPEKLYGANKLGGMPVPSLAINKASEPLLDRFGDITLVGGKEMAIPSKVNPVFKSDAYTKRRPEIIYNMDDKSEQNLKKMFGDLPKELPRGEQELGNLIENIGKAPDNKLVQAKFLQEKGMLPNPADYTDKWQFNEQVSKLRQANQSEFDSWLDNFNSTLPENGVKVKEQLYKGYSNTTGKRKYAPADLENIVKEMKGGANTEGWDYGVGNLRAVATPKFKKFDEITKSRDRILSNDDFTKVKEKSDEIYNSLRSRLYELDKNYSAGDAMLEVAETGNINALDRIYKDLPKELKADVSVYINGLKQMPSTYFEIKPQRAVSIGEFKGAIVPSDLPDKARTVLEKAGIKDIYTYANAEERKALTKKFGKEMFAGIPALPLAMPTDDAKAKTRQQILEEQFNKKRVE
jgi:hypothetical protein